MALARKYFVFLVIIFIAFSLRFYRLGENPPSLTWDEASWGYNAYSLGIDGQDEFGKFLPIAYIESFGDFKPPLYAYLSILPIKIFGLNEFGTRFASAFLGSITVLLTYFLTREILRENFRQFSIATIAAFLLAVSPWHILLSRAAFEANVATFFIVFAVLLFFLAIKKQGFFLVLSFISFVLSMYAFNTARIVSPMLLFLLLFLKKDAIFRMKKQLLLALFSAFILFLPLGAFLTTPQAKLRFAEVNIFSDSSVVEIANRQIENDKNAYWSRIIHNRRLVYAVEYLRHFFDNLNPSFLFVKGDGNPKFSIQDVGQMYIWEIPFFIYGLFLLFRKKQGDWWIFPAWLLAGIAPAATARETPHALRIESSLPTFQMITAYGMYYLIAIAKDKIVNNKIRSAIFSLCFLIIFFNFLYFYHNYFIHYRREFSSEWQYGYKQAINYVKEIEKNYDAIYFTKSLGRPYIYFLFHTGYNPKNFRDEAVVEREVFGFVHVNSFGKYRFATDLNLLDSAGEKILYIDIPQRVPKNAVVQNSFKLLNNDEVLIAFTK